MSTPATARSWSARTSSTPTWTTPSGRSSRTRRRSTTRPRDTRVHWCFTAGAGLRRGRRHAGLAAALGRRPGHRRVDEHHAAATTRSRCTTGTATTPFTVGTETATPRPDRDYTYPWTNQWFEERCNPDDVHLAASATTSTRRGPTCSPCTTGCTTGRTTSASPRRPFNMQARQPRPRRARRRPGAGQRPGRRHQRRPARLRGPRQRQPDHAARRHRRRSPTCTCGSRSRARSTRPCVDGDYDMSVIAHEYTHAITNRMIAGPNAGLSSPAGHERELVGPAGHGVPATSTATRRAGAARPSPSASTSPPTRSPASATTT